MRELWVLVGLLHVLVDPAAKSRGLLLVSARGGGRGGGHYHYNSYASSSRQYHHQSSTITASRNHAASSSSGSTSTTGGRRFFPFFFPFHYHQQNLLNAREACRQQHQQQQASAQDDYLPVEASENDRDDFVDQTVSNYYLEYDDDSAADLDTSVFKGCDLSAEQAYGEEQPPTWKDRFFLALFVLGGLSCCYLMWGVAGREDTKDTTSTTTRTANAMDTPSIRCEAHTMNDPSYHSYYYHHEGLVAYDDNIGSPIHESHHYEPPCRDHILSVSVKPAHRSFTFPESMGPVDNSMHGTLPRANKKPRYPPAVQLSNEPGLLGPLHPNHHHHRHHDPTPRPQPPPSPFIVVRGLPVAENEAVADSYRKAKPTQPMIL